MQAVILAAGRGERLADRAPSKPLLTVAGHPLIEHVLIRMRSIGIRDFVVVTGYNGGRVRGFLNGPAGTGIRLTLIDNPEWARANGVSVLCARGAVHGPFFLLMCDHLFDPTIAADLRTAPRDGAETMLAVDRRIENHPWIDLDDVTKVWVGEGDRIVDIGKTISRYNAFDTGVFLCSPGLFPALEQSRDEGDDSLSGGIRRLAARGLARAFNIGSRDWIDVDDPVTLEKARRLADRFGGESVPHRGESS